jgi:hypothetical protein
MKTSWYIKYLLFVHPLTMFAQSSSGPYSGSTFSNDNSVGTIAFNSPSNAGTSDNILSSASATVSLFSDNTQYLKATGFGFALPNNSSVSGIRVEVEKSATGINIFATVKDNAVRLVKAGSPVGSDYGKTSNWSSSSAYYTYGGSSDLWGTTWSRTDVNSATFGVAFSAEINGLISVLPSAHIDHIRITVYFNIILPTKISSFSATTGKDHSAYLQWLCDDVNENSQLNVQRKTAKEDWKTIQSFKEKSNGYIDTDCKSEQAQYRLQIQQADNSYTYSNIVSVSWEKNSFTIYPNPAKNEINVNLSVKSTFAYCNGTNGSRWRLPTIQSNDLVTKLDTHQLPPGTYVLNLNGKKQIFIKKL